MLNKENRIKPLNPFRREGNLIYIKIGGLQDDISARRAFDDLKKHIDETRAKGSKAYVFVDISDLSPSDIGTSSRLILKEAFSQPYTSLAVLGKPGLAEIALYLISASGADQKARFFTSEKAARQWLKSNSSKIPTRSNILLYAALIAAALAGLGLFGWYTEFPLLTKFAPSLKPTNPISVVGMTIVSLGLYSIWKDKRKLTIACAIGLITIGFLALLPIDIGFDYWLLTDQVVALKNAGIRIALSDSAAIVFVGLGILFIMQNVRQRRRMMWVYGGTIMLLLLLTEFNAFGLFYAPDFIYSISPTFAMSLPAALGLAIVLIAFGVDAIELNRGNATIEISPLGWLIISALLIIQAATYGGWVITSTRIKDVANSNFQTRTSQVLGVVTSHANAYTSSLQGFRAMFAASNSVTQGEFEAYYNATNIAKNYPGLRAISFITKVDSKDLPAFVASRRADTSLHPKGNADFSIKQQSKQNTHYIETYIAGTSDLSSLGTDFADRPERVAAYEKASQKNDISTSSTTQISETNKSGFFVTTPVKNVLQINNTYKEVTGFVSVDFTFNDLFSSLLGSTLTTSGISIDVTDITSKTKIFSKSNLKNNNSLITSSTPATIGDHTWDVNVKAPSNFGVDTTQKALPITVLIAGQALSVLLIVIFFIQSSARRRAVILAAAMTEDLKNERDNAINTKKRDETILSSIADGLIIFNKNLRIQRVNGATTEMLGYSKEEMTGRLFDKILYAVNQKGKPIPAEQRDIARTIIERRIIKGELKYRRKDGSFFDVQYTCAPLIINNRVDGVIEIFRDVTQEKILDRAKTDFVSLTSHQLRTPLSAIKWLSEMLLSGELGKVNKEQFSQLREIYRSNQRMIDLVNALLDVSRLEVGKLKNEVQETSVISLTKNILDELEPLTNSKKLTLIRHIPYKLPPVFADPKLLRMVILNVLNNSLKYTDKGTVTLTMREATADDITRLKVQPKQSLYIEVADTGMGIPEKSKKHIFEKLYRADNVRAMDVEGTGLGLYITKEIVQMFGGVISFDSKEGKGTHFYIVIPFKTLTSK